MTPQEFARYFDHTLLRQNMTLEELREMVEAAGTYGFASICIPPLYVATAKKLDPMVTVATVIDFPLGYSGLASKLAQTEAALADGADEIDMVASVPLLMNREEEAYAREIREIKGLMGSRLLKVILETSLLSPEEIVLASRLAQGAGADFIKTSTGFGSRGATLEDIALIRQGAPGCKIKASGGIKTLEAAMSFLSAGVERIGSSNSAAILDLFVVS